MVCCIGLTLEQEKVNARCSSTAAKRGNPPAYNTRHQEMVTLRQRLKTAIR
jgi:hypothetical protein